MTTPASRGAYWLVVLVLAWGAFAFGGVYDWAYWPLVAGSMGAGAAGIAWGSPTRVQLSAVGLSFGAFLVAAAAQTVTLPLTVLALVSPETVRALRALDVRAATGLVQGHPLSLDPARTWKALAMVAALGLLAAGASRLFSRHGVRPFVFAVSVLGVLLAVEGIVQRGLPSGLVYGFWQPRMPNARPFGPFINRNHFAGWMLMALPLTLAMVPAGLARAPAHPTWRARLVWLTSDDAVGLVWYGGAAVLMALSVVLTMSRSGMAGALVALVITIGGLMRRRDTSSFRAASLGYLAVLVVVVVAWVGGDVIAARFADADWGQFNDRRGAWLDAWSIARAFPVAGTGLNTYGVATFLYQRHDVGRHYAEAHNDYLQLAAEGGLLLVVPAVLCLGAFVRAVRRAFEPEGSATAYWARVGAITGLSALAFQELVEFSAQIPANAALAAVLCGIALHAPPARRSRAFV